MHTAQVRDLRRAAVPRPRRSSIRTLALVTLAVAASACDETFTPLAPSQLAFSIFGYLDASADTQWIRLMPIRETVLTQPGAFAATVTLQRLDSLETIVLIDSVFRFTTGSDVGSEGFFLHNFWTTDPIVPGASYRLLAEWEEGGQSTSSVDIPTDYVTEVWIAQPWARAYDYLHLEGLTHRGIVRLTTYYHDGCGPGAYRRVLEPGSSPTGVHDVRLIRDFVGRTSLCGRPTPDRREVLVVGSGAEWPTGPGYGTGDLGVPDAPTNIENGIGFLAGVLTHTLPWEECILEEVESVADHCRLEYNERTATLAGVVSDVRCTGEGVPRAAVVLRELDPVPEGRKTRPTTTGGAGDYLISGLDATQHFELTVRRFVPGDRFQHYEEHVDTLVFEPGEQMRYDVALERPVCPA